MRSSSTSSRAGRRSVLLERLREADQGRPALELHRRPGDREQDARRPHRLGPDAEGRLPALQGAARLRPALPERLRLPGPLDRGRGRARARAQLEARDRGVRPRGVRAPLPGGRRAVGGGADPRLEAPRPVDGLGQRLLHLQRHEHRDHLALPPVSYEKGWLYRGHRATEWCPRCGTSISAASSWPRAGTMSTAQIRRLRAFSVEGAPLASRSSFRRRRPGRCRRTSPPR